MVLSWSEGESRQKACGGDSRKITPEVTYGGDKNARPGTKLLLQPATPVGRIGVARHRVHGLSEAEGAGEIDANVEVAELLGRDLDPLARSRLRAHRRECHGASGPAEIEHGAELHGVAVVRSRPPRVSMDRAPGRAVRRGCHAREGSQYAGTGSRVLHRCTHWGPEMTSVGGCVVTRRRDKRRDPGLRQVHWHAGIQMRLWECEMWVMDYFAVMTPLRVELEISRLPFAHSNSLADHPSSRP